MAVLAPTALPDRVRRASDLARDRVAGGPNRVLPVAPELRPLLPALRRGSTVAVAPGTSSLVLALIAPASAAGAWVAVVGMPGFGALAAAQAGVVWERLALVPHPEPEWGTVVATLLDGFDIVVTVPPGPVAPRLAGRLAARARQRGSVLVPYGRWEGAELTLTAGQGAWEGLGAGHGRLRRRELTITARGRGAAGRPRQVRVTLPDAAGRLGPARPATRPAPTQPAPAWVAAGQRAATRTGRPDLTLIPGTGERAVRRA
ncbi:MAG TPA: hypothetical protein VKZ74_02710 [Natronosporangium sp.]|nr:hypothetical protein [Natronosporangium sp.]